MNTQQALVKHFDGARLEIHVHGCKTQNKQDKVI